MTAHALYSASAAHRWIECPASLALTKDIPRTSSIYADEGTAAHELAQICLTEGLSAADMIDRTIVVGNNRFVVDADMAEHVQSYIDYVSSVKAGDPDSILMIEERVYYGKTLDTDDTAAFGTCDAIIYYPSTGDLFVVDLKYGRGERVEATNNPQLMLYALGAMRAVELVGEVSRLNMAIIQPRINNTGEWTLDLTCESDQKLLIRFVASAMSAVVASTIDDTAPKAGEKQCRWCAAKPQCPALRLEVLNTLANGAASFHDLTEAALVKPQADDIALIYAKLDLIENWVSAVRVHAYQRLKNGETLDGYKLVAGRKGARAWGDATEAEAVMKSMRLKTDEMYDLKLISPTTAEKTLSTTPKRWARLAKHVTQADGKPTIAPLSDKRPALSLSAGFAHIETVSEDALV